jgi:photosystem II stability/assembly factor-like uncharacterized protein
MIKDILKISITVLLSVLLSTPMFSQSWETISSPTSYLLTDVHFGGNQSETGFIVGESSTYNGTGVILKTTDEGATWTDITVGTIPGLEACWFTSQDTGYIGGWQNYFAKTTDAGASWTPIVIDPNIWYIKDIEFWDANNGVVATADGDIFYTSNAGATWTKATGLSQSTHDVCYGSATTLYVVGNDEKISKSTDGGHTWSNIYTGIFQMSFMGVDFSTANYGIVGGEDGKKMVTQDGGQTWTTNYTGGNNVNTAYVFEEDSIYTTGSPALIYISHDDGNNWQLDYSDPPGAHKKIKFTYGGNGFVVGGSGTILRKMASLSVAFSADTDSVCATNSVNFTDESTGNPTSWLWSFEGGTPATSTEQNPVVFYNTPGVYDVTLTISDGDTSLTLLKPDMITVIDEPAQPDTPEGDQNVCSGYSADYTTHSVAYADSYTWEVLPADAGTIDGDDTTATFIASDTWTGDYTIKVKAANMCSESNWSDELNCTLNPNPGEFTISDGGSYCQGGNGIEITLDGSETGIKYVLYLDNLMVGDSVAGTGNPISFGYYTDAGTYTSQGFGAYCSSDMSGEAVITIDSLPAATEIPQGADTICGETTSDYTIAQAQRATSYLWTISPADAGTITGNDTVGTVTWTTGFTGSAYIAAYGQNSCGTGTTQDSLLVSVLNSPTPVINGDNLVCHLDEGTYTVEYNENSSYQWTITGSGEITSGQGTNEITVFWTAPQGATTYVDVTETVNNNCSGSAETFTVTIDQCTAVGETTEANILVYPNPVNDVLSVSLTGLNSASVNMKLVNLQGQIVYQENKKVDNGSLITKIKVNNLPPTVYYLLIEAGNMNTISNKVVVIK